MKTREIMQRLDAACRVCRLRAVGAGLLAGSLMVSASSAFADRGYADLPLFYAAGAKPNVMLAIDDSGSMDDVPSGDTTAKMAVLKTVANQVVNDNAANMNIGLFTFWSGSNSTGGGKYQLPCGSSAADLTAQIGNYEYKPGGASCSTGYTRHQNYHGNDSDYCFTGLYPNTSTPLASQLYEVMRYFRGMSPSSSNSSSLSSYPSPMQYRCQKNFVVVLTDGQPTSGMEDSGTAPTDTSIGGVSNPWGGWDLDTAGKSWDGYADNQIGGSGGYYPLTDDVAQFGYDIDMRGTSSTTTGCPTGGPADAGTAGKDCAGKSWNDSEFPKQNVVPYVIGFDLENELLHDAPLVNRLVVTDSNVDAAADTITITDHGLQTGDYVQYHALKDDYVMKGLGDVGSNVVSISNGADVTVPASGTPVQYSDKGDTTLQYAVTTTTPRSLTVAAGSGSTNNVNISNNQFTGSTANMTDGMSITYTTQPRYEIRYLDSATSTLTTSSISTSADTLTLTATNLVVGSELKYSGASGSNFQINSVTQASGTVYYVQSCGTVSTVGASCSNSSIKLASSPGGTALNITSAGSGTHSFQYQKALPDYNSSSTNVTYNLFVKQVIDSNHFTLSASSGGAVLDIVGFGGQGSNNRSQAFSWTTSTTSNVSAGAYYVIKISNSEFKLALSAADATASTPVPVTISNAGNANQTFTYQGSRTSIGGLYPYLTDTPSDSSPDPATENGAAGKYCVKRIDDNKIQLGLAYTGSEVVCPLGPAKASATANYSSVDGSSTKESITTSANHGFDTGDVVTFTCTDSGCNVGGITNSTTAKWYVAKVSATTFRLATTAANATACAAGTMSSCKDLSSSASGSNRKFTRAEVKDFTLVPISNVANAAGILSAGPGKAYFSDSAATLSAALNAAFQDIDTLSLSASAVASSSGEFSTGSYVYQARFNPSDWSGDLVALPILANGSVSTTPSWNASTMMPAPTSRTLLTYNNGGKTLEWGNLDPSTQQKYITQGTGDQQTGEKVISWLKGTDQTDDVNFRLRLNGNLGDIINSNPAFVGSSNDEGYGALAGSIGTDYGQFVSNKSQLYRPNGMLVVGGNDGMVHVFNGGTGVELMGFIPKGVFMDWAEADNNGNGIYESEPIDYKLFNLTQKFYGQSGNPHRYFVDGSPTVGDAYLSGWKTVAVGGLGRGGRSVYAIDVTDTQFGASDVLWEFNDSNSGNMGYSFSRPVIGKLTDGTWVAIFGNGYDSAGDQAKLFVVNLQTGAKIDLISTGVGGTSAPNGLSSVTALLGGTDGKSIVAVYAGDLLGNVWRFSNFSSQGGGTATRIFTATDGTNPQPITAAPTVESYNGGVLVHVGTGKYFETGDKSYISGETLPTYNSLYTLFDDGSSTLIDKTNLVQQWVTGTVTGQDAQGRTKTFLTSTQKDVTYGATVKGWYMDLVDGGGSSVPGGTYLGERSVTEAAVYGPRMLFTTLIPGDVDQCQGGGSSRFFELNSTTGAMIGKRILDTNGDGAIDDNDALVSGVEYEGGILSRPLILPKVDDDGKKSLEKIFGSTSKTEPVVVIDNSGIDCSETDSCSEVSPGRMSWRQLK